MRRVPRCAYGAMLPIYERIIESYGPYVLVRCAQYTNDRRQAQEIGVYTLITTCIAVGELEHVGGQLGRVVDIMVEVIGPDVASGGQAEVRRGEPDERLIADPRLYKMAAALNALKRPWREVLVLHHVTGMEPDDLSRLLRKPALEVAARIRKGERLLAESLGVPDVRPLLARLAAGLDSGWRAEVADGAMDYLALRAALLGRAAQGDHAPAYWLN